MKVSDIMQTTVDFVHPETTIMEASRIIFGRGHTGLSVISKKSKKLIGFISEQNILESFFPSMKEYMEDYVHTRDFEGMEQKVREIMSFKVGDVMSKRVVRVFAKEPILKAQSIMQTKGISHLPVTDAQDRLIGMITKGDIFRVLVGETLPVQPYEEFYDWISPLYDPMINWEKRLKNEIPDIVALYKKHDYRSILDIGCGTGEHCIALAERGLVVTGIDSSSEMISRAEKKLLSLSLPVRKRLTFLTISAFLKTIQERKKSFDMGLFLGSALSHFASDQRLLQPIMSAFKPQSTLVLQIWNLAELTTSPYEHPGISLKIVQRHHENKLLFVKFFDHINNKWQHTTAIFFLDGVRWVLEGLNSTPVTYLDKTTTAVLLKPFGFTKLTFFGGETNGRLTDEKLDPLGEIWLNTIAERMA